MEPCNESPDVESVDSAEDSAEAEMDGTLHSL